MERFKLGRIPSPPNPTLFRMSNYMDVSALPSAPTVTNWREKVRDWGAMLNDRLGCCTVSAIGHAIQVWTANDGPAQVTVPDANIQNFYSAIGGYVPGRPGTDRGANMIDALNRWRSAGLSGHNGIGYVGVDPRNLDQVRASLWLFGGLYGGCTIPASWLQGQWDRVGGGWAGGHAWWLVDREGPDFWVQTWGQLRRFTSAAWLATMGDQPSAELYAVLGPEWTGVDKMAPSGFDRAALENDLAEIGGRPKPNPDKPPPPPPPSEGKTTIVINGSTYDVTMVKRA